MSASNTYRQGQDAISQFIADNVIVTEDGRISKTDLKIWYKNWVEQTYGEKNGPQLKDVGDEMNKRFRRCEKTKVWLGVALIDARVLMGEVADEDIQEVDRQDM